MTELCVEQGAVFFLVDAKLHCDSKSTYCKVVPPPLPIIRPTLDELDHRTRCKTTSLMVVGTNAGIGKQHVPQPILYFRRGRELSVLNVRITNPARARVGDMFY